MINGILGIKVGMTQLFEKDGTAVPATVIKAGPCVIVQKKTAAHDGYDAVQLGLVQFVADKRVKKGMQGHFKKANVSPVRFLKEFRLQESAESTQVGSKVLVDQFSPSDSVDVSGVSKGKGFAGVIKRHNFRGGAATHGSMFHRAPGSIGASAFPSRVLKGMRAAGHMGQDNVTTKNLQVVRVDVEKNLLIVRGAVPGANGGYVVIRKKS
ncbi:MAG: 50S ribosomal protein L3 [Acidobacteria bacterium]|nr:50S ribosomal protein L3 [Acidobacteriota bacterium]MCI0625699.1 50S ribosomal protein L3 [Acidobacteriota bacterium]MCI0722616.1 50S ribosomal protein L3 [Acidobacteriota bacterium]